MPSRALVPIAAAAATLVTTSPIVGAENGPACNSPAWVAASRAVDAWCDGRASVRRRYYDWSLAETRRRACSDLRVALAKCGAELWEAKEWESNAAPGLVVLAPYPDAELTFWEVHLAPRGRGYKVRSVDFMEDCTGP